LETDAKKGKSEGNLKGCPSAGQCVSLTCMHCSIENCLRDFQYDCVQFSNMFVLLKVIYILRGVNYHFNWHTPFLKVELI